jgi:transcriptional regulator with XRE-family HTH domain
VQRQDSNLIVARKVRQLRTKRGWSQEEFADFCGVHRTWIGSIERGEGNITLKTLDQLAKVLGVHSYDLLKG